MLIDEIYDLMLNTSGTPFTVSNLYIGEMVRDQYGVYLIQNSSAPPDMYTGVEEYEIDVWSRTKTVSEGYVLQQWIYDLFHQKAHYDLGAYHIYFTNCLGQIADMDRDAEGNKLLRLSVRWITGITVS